MKNKIRLTEEEQHSLISAYQLMWERYKEIKRSRKDTRKTREIKLKWIKENLISLQKVYNKLNIDVQYSSIN